MKRFFLTAIALAAVAVSCTKSGLLESPKTYEAPISFEPYTGKALTTKASVVKTENIATDGFKVLGFIEADGENSTTIIPSSADFTFEKVYIPNGKTAWQYDGDPVYWPDSKDVTFVAYGLNANVNNPVDGNYAQITYTVPGKVAEQKDLVLSPVMQNLNGVEQDGPVSVYLYHALSRVGFTLKTQGIKDATSEAVVTIKDISLCGGFATAATFDLSRIAAPGEGVKTLTYIPYKTETASTYNYKPAAANSIRYSLFDIPYLEDGSDTPSFLTTAVPAATAETEGFKTSTEGNFTYKTYPVYHTTNTKGNVSTPMTGTMGKRYMMILPGTVADLTSNSGLQADTDNDGTVDATPYIKVEYQLTNGEAQTAIIPLQTSGNNFSFEAGKAYEFVFTVSTISVGFSVDVNIWNPTDPNSTTTTVPITETLPL